MVAAFRNHDVLLQIQINLTFSASFPRPRLHLDFHYAVPIYRPALSGVVVVLVLCWNSSSMLDLLIIFYSFNSKWFNYSPSMSNGIFQVKSACKLSATYQVHLLEWAKVRSGQVRAGQQINLLFHYSKATICLAPEVDFSCLTRLTIIITSSLAAIPHFPHL